MLIKRLISVILGLSLASQSLAYNGGHLQLTDQNNFTSGFHPAAAFFDNQALSVSPLSNRFSLLSPLRSFWGLLIKFWDALPTEFSSASGPFVLPTSWGGSKDPRLPPHWENDPLIREAYTLAKVVYKDRKLPSGKPYLASSYMAAILLESMYDQTKIQGPSLAIAACLLGLTAPDQLPFFIRKLKTDSHQDLHEIQKNLTPLTVLMNTADRTLKIAYVPPGHEELKSAAPWARRNILNHMGKIVQQTTYDALMISVAQRLAILADRGTESSIKEHLAKEFEEVIHPLFGWNADDLLSQFLRDRAFHLAHPKLHQSISSEIDKLTGIKAHARRQAFADHRAAVLQMILRDEGLKGVRVIGRAKMPAAIDYKMEVKSDEYEQVSDIRDLVAFRIIATSEEERDLAMLKMSELYEVLIDKKAEKRLQREGVEQVNYDYVMPNFDDDFTPDRKKSMKVEIQYFRNDAEYKAARYGPGKDGKGGATWVYKLRRDTGQIIDFDSFEIIEGDSYGNFDRLKASLRPFIYLDVPFERKSDRKKKSEKGEPTYVTIRIPRRESTAAEPHQNGGNLADAAWEIGQLDDTFYGGYVYQTTYDPQTGKLTTTKDKKVIKPPKEILEDGKTVEIVQSDKTTGKPRKNAWQAALATTAGNRAFVHLADLTHGEADERIRTGEKVLIDYFRRQWNLAPVIKSNFVFASTFREQVLQKAAPAYDVKTADEFLELLGLQGLTGTPQREALNLSEIARQTHLRGIEVLSNKFDYYDPALAEPLKRVTASFGLGTDKRQLLMALGASFLSLQDIENRMKEFVPRLDKEESSRTKEGQITARYLYRLRDRHGLPSLVDKEMSNSGVTILPTGYPTRKVSKIPGMAVLGFIVQGSPQQIASMERDLRGFMAKHPSSTDSDASKRDRPSRLTRAELRQGLWIGIIGGALSASEFAIWMIEFAPHHLQVVHILAVCLSSTVLGGIGGLLAFLVAEWVLHEGSHKVMALWRGYYDVHIRPDEFGNIEVWGRREGEGPFPKPDVVRDPHVRWAGVVGSGISAALAIWLEFGILWPKIINVIARPTGGATGDMGILFLGSLLIGFLIPVAFIGLRNIFAERAPISPLRTEEPWILLPEHTVRPDTHNPQYVFERESRADSAYLRFTGLSDPAAMLAKLLPALQEEGIIGYANFSLEDTAKGFVLSVPYREEDAKGKGLALRSKIQSIFDEDKRIFDEDKGVDRLSPDLQWRQLNIHLSHPWLFQNLEQWLREEGIQIVSIWPTVTPKGIATGQYRMVLAGPDKMMAADEKLGGDLALQLQTQRQTWEKSAGTPEVFVDRSRIQVTDFVDLNSTVERTATGVRITLAHRLDSIGLMWRVLDTLPPGWLVDGRVRTFPVKDGSTISIELTRERTRRMIWLFRALDWLLSRLISWHPPQRLLDSLQMWRADVKEHTRTARQPATDRDLEELRSNLSRLKLLQDKPLPAQESRRLWLHFWLADLPGSLKQVFRALAQKKGNIIYGTLQPPEEVGGNGLVDLEVLAPNTLSIEDLETLLTGLTFPSPKNPYGSIPLLSKAENQKPEVVNMTMSKATARAVCDLLLSRLGKVPGWVNIGWVKDLLAFRDIPGEEEGELDKQYIEQFKAILDLMDDIHGNPLRDKKERWPLAADENRKLELETPLPYVVHLMETTYNWVASGKRHPIGAIDCILHDAFESGPKNIWRRFVFGLEDSSLLEQFVSAFPDLGPEMHQAHTIAVAAAQALEIPYATIAEALLSSEFTENPLALDPRVQSLHKLLDELEPLLNAAAREKIEIRMRQDIRFYPDKIIRDIEILTKYESYEDYVNNLSDSELDYLVELKLWEQANNYKTLHLMEDPVFASKILSRGIRYMLPLVMHSSFQRTDAYQYSRKEFLVQLIEQTLKLNQPLYPYPDIDAVTGEPEDPAKANANIAQTITSFLAWLDDKDNANMIPSDRLKPEEIQVFRGSLLKLREQALANVARAPAVETHPSPPQGQPPPGIRYTTILEKLLTWIRPSKGGKRSTKIHMKKAMEVAV
jgi:hypothetical protein